MSLLCSVKPLIQSFVAIRCLLELGKGASSTKMNLSV
ncbi:hypothetical protein POX_e06155 [Penicillium oxalicum]|uniref:Uncharacterized protein n=1 Tax=Penicillium oxalicum (strain 114-2 / CGMCC 5302) TaxID=933388 RepID=S8AYW5_PENO1|nr:hypothetical protein POX_e06155 [Penicillium oxalicum]EPS27177.1 hypothetical protein PDE_02120 [Penicillium oxalicum 114-2]KAI2788143.1 hypothetical protein POX_e06155 [Penicillium oxalicum]